MNPLWLMTLGRLKQFVREPGALFWTFGFPLLLTIALGFAFRPESTVKNRVAVIDNAESKTVMQALAGDPRLLVELHSASETEQLLSRNQVIVAVEKTSGIIYHFDRQRPNAENLRRYLDERLQEEAGRKNAVTTRDEAAQSQGARYIDWLVPGLLGMQLMSGSLYGVAWAVVENRQRKLLKRLAATPMRRRDYLLSYLIARLFAVLPEVVTLLVFAKLTFAVTVHGSWGALAAVCFFGSASFVGLALLCAARAQNSETVNGLMNLAILPMYLFCSVFFSSANFPDWSQPVIKLLPLSAMNAALRAIINEGAPLSALVPHFLIMAAWGVISFVIALRIFRWT